MPPYDQMMQIIKAIQESENMRYGFIVSLRSHADAYEKFNNLKLDNLMLRSWVPQREVLRHPKT